MNALRLTSSLVFLLAAAAPALADPFDAFRGPLKGILAPADNCPHEKALAILDRYRMTLVAEVPRTDALYRFVVDWKSDQYAVTVGTSNCKLNVVDYARAVEPYCNYLPGVMSSCQNLQLFMQ